MSRVQQTVKAVAKTAPVRYLGDDISSSDSHVAAMVDRGLNGAALNTLLPPTLMGVWNNQSPETLGYLFNFFKDYHLLPVAPAINILVMTTVFTSIEFAGRNFTRNLDKSDNLVHFPLGAAVRRRDAALFVMFGLMLQTINGVAAQYDRKDGLYGMVSAMYGDAVGASVLQNIVLFFLAALTNATYVIGKEVYRRATTTSQSHVEEVSDDVRTEASAPVVVSSINNNDSADNAKQGCLARVCALFSRKKEAGTEKGTQEATSLITHVST